MITMPDFNIWATCILPRVDYIDVDEVAEALKQAFEQGRSLGIMESTHIKEKETLLNTQDIWYDAIDGDTAEQERLQDGVVQKKDKASGCYVARYVATGIEVGRRCGGQPFANILIEE